MMHDGGQRRLKQEQWKSSKERWTAQHTASVLSSHHRFEKSSGHRVTTLPTERIPQVPRSDFAESCHASDSFYFEGTFQSIRFHSEAPAWCTFPFRNIWDSERYGYFSCKCKWFGWGRGKCHACSVQDSQNGLAGVACRTING